MTATRKPVERVFWGWNAASILVAVVGYVFAGFSVAWLSNMPVYAGFVITTWVWLLWKVSDQAQAWVWRRGLRP